MAKHFFAKLQEYSNRTAIYQNNRSYSYKELLQKMDEYLALIYSLPPHSKVAIQNDYSLESIALFLALLHDKHTIISIINTNELPGTFFLIGTSFHSSRVLKFFKFYFSFNALGELACKVS